MNIDWTFSVANIITVVGALIAGVIAWVKLSGRVARIEDEVAEIHQTVDRYRTEVSTNFGAVTAQLKMHHEQIMDRLAENGRQLMEFKLDVAKNYAGNTSLEKVEERLGGQLKDIANRIDEMAPRQRRQN